MESRSITETRIRSPIRSATRRFNYIKDVKNITKAVFEGEVFLGIRGGAKAIAKNLSSLPLHPEAEAFYEEAGYLPQKPSFNWLRPMYYTVGILVVLAASLKALIAVKRDRAKSKVTPEITGVSLDYK